MFLSASQLPPPTPPHPNPTSLSPRFILTSPWEESATIYCNTQRALHTQSTLTPHACAHTHTCQITIVPGELRQSRNFYWVGFQSEHRSNSPLFSTVIQCVLIQCIWNEKAWSCMGNIISKATAAILAEYQMFLSDFDPIQHYCMGLISENKGYSPRRSLILACIPWCRQRDIHKMCRCCCVLSAELKVYFISSFLFYMEKYLPAQ